MIGRVRAQLERLRDVLPGGFGRTSFSQEGEDLILERIFENQSSGTYVDVGAHHPLRFSNTLLLYRRGWRGMNIDATPGSMAAFRNLRPRDINLEVGVTAEAGERDFYVFNEPALNTFDAERARSLVHRPYVIESVKKVRCAPLSTLVSEHALTTIDLLAIDAEGFDFEVLQTLDWTAHRPRCVITEQLSQGIEELVASDPYAFLRERGYRVIAKTFNSVFYVTP